MTIVILVSVAVVSILIIRLLIHFSSNIKFIATGLDSKFTMREIFMLWRLAKVSDLEEPQKLFWSVPELSRCITHIIEESENNKTLDSDKTQMFLSKLYKYRTKIELGKKHGLDSSRELDTHQKLRIIFPGCGVFFSEVLNSGRELIIKLPTQDGLIKIKGDEWVGKTINIYLWRKGDACYVFDSKVLSSGVFNGQTAIYITHSDNMLRAQKRRFVRCECKLPAQLYIIKDEIVNYSLVETEQGYRCYLEDISEDGALIRVAGKGLENIQIKIQFTIEDSFIIMFGVVHAVEYNSKINQSKLHLGCTHVDPIMKNEILSFVYKTLPQKQKEIFDAITQTEDDAKALGDTIQENNESEKNEASNSDTSEIVFPDEELPNLDTTEE